MQGKLGDYIVLCKQKNKNLEVTKLVGISYSKGILDKPQRKASTSYLKTGWIAKKGEFVVDLVNVQHNNHLSVDINRSEEPIVISHIYNVFKISNPLLVGEYLLLLLKNSVMEHRLKYACHGSVRGTLSWDNFSGIPIFVPELKDQESIVNKYQTVTKYIEVKKRINELLERKMKAYFHILFDDLKDYEMRSFGELFTIIRGGRPPRSNRWLEELYFCKEGGVPWLQVRDITKKEFKFVRNTAEQLTEQGFKRGNCSIVSPNDLIFIHNASSKQLGNIYVNSCDLTINSNFWALSNNLPCGGGINVVCP
ncbi:hypothetical protein WEN_02480 [Mycoplasma wenyonii str. Massachusetts]|uniref:Type I restriction modification DNA specificity domain-containing protein n=1 Tax=Mycoplasma wenyonii (strain Massachusetts) TaxID=1197325 RepID=I6Z6T2_MYCWM|nr:restriction endonuclease subunit S [Mycoplasma wenyonii]AFN65283.1 hypothetical protein WEN_02480 [Mycoplasma wenyonii str. Massachusetts]